jgi:hypothetical protein
MGKAARNQRREERDQIRILDASRLITSVRYLVANHNNPGITSSRQQLGRVLACIMQEWDRSPVVLRADAGLVTALVTSDRDVTLPPIWLDRFPYDAVAVSLVEPIELDDGDRRCTYLGFVVSGIRSKKAGLDQAWTTYHPVAERDGVRIVWIFTDNETGIVGGQTVTAFFRTNDTTVPTLGEITLADVIAMAGAGYRDSSTSDGSEADVLAAFSISFLLYLCAAEPDVEPLPRQSPAWPRHLQNAQVANVGWRVGAAFSRDIGRESEEEAEVAPHGGWRLPPHIRRAHWTHVRVATRDEAGVVIGDRLGEAGIDWHHELRWIPPVAVNAVQGVTAPTVKDVDISNTPFVT